MCKQHRANMAVIILRFLRRAKSRWNQSNWEVGVFDDRCSIFEQRSHSCEIAKKKFDSNWAWHQVKLLSIEHPKTTASRTVSTRNRSNSFSLHGFRDTVRRDKAMKCCRIIQNDSTFPSLKLIHETGANPALTFPSCKLQIKGAGCASTLPSRSRLNHNSPGILFCEPLSVEWQGERYCIANIVELNDLQKPLICSFVL